MIKKIKILKILQENYGWIVATITGLTVVTSFLLRALKYICSNYYFYYYGISYELFNNNELGFLYDFGFFALTLLCFGSIIYCYIQLFNVKKNKLKIQTIIFNVILILITNLFTLYSINSKYSFLQLAINFIILIIIEFIFSKVLLKSNEKEKDKEYTLIYLFNHLKTFPFYLILLVFVFLLNYGYKIINNKSYRIIDNDRVIVYTTNDYYLVLECEIIDNKLIIYKGKQTKISNENIASKIIKFDEIELK